MFIKTIITIVMLVISLGICLNSYAEDFSIGAKTDKLFYDSGEDVTVHVYAENNLTEDLLIIGEGVFGIENLYGDTGVYYWNGNLSGELGPHGGDIGQFQMYEPYVEAGPIIRIPARSNVVFAFRKFDRFFTQPPSDYINPGQYILSLTLNRIESENGQPLSENYAVTVPFEVVEGFYPPVIDEYSPDWTQTVIVTEGTLITFTITASDQNQEDRLYTQWKIDSNFVEPSEENGTNPITSTWIFDTTGMAREAFYNVRCKVRDREDGGRSTEIQWIVKVNASGVSKPKK